MESQIASERLVSMAELAKMLTKAYQRRITDRRVREWADIGRMSRTNGKRCYLETVEMPWGKATSFEAYQRFVEELNET